jgi:hypothetical protein
MKQHEAVIVAMREEGGYATLGRLYQTVPRVLDCRWGTKTPFASIRRIVQDHPDIFFRIRPGLWALVERRKQLPETVLASPSTPAPVKAEQTHAYFQGLLLELGAMKHLETCVPSQDRNKPFMNATLAQAASLSEIYHFTYDETMRKAQTVDVVWFNARRMPHTFFEVENSTDMLNSLSKFVELQDFRAEFVIVADQLREREYQGRVALSAFRDLTETVKFRSYEYVADWHSKMSALRAIEGARTP